MIPRAIESAMRYRWVVLGLVLLVGLAGLYSFQQQPIDAYPDISAQMVQVITTYPGRATEEVERQVTVPIEIAMRNVPNVEVIRSRTIFGLSVVQMIFVEGTEQYWARQRVQEKLTGLKLPEGADADLGPPNTSYDEIYRYVVESDGTHTMMELRELNDWLIIPRLLRVPGVSDVSNFGGLGKQFTVTFRPADLDHYRLSLNDVVDSLKSNNALAGGSVVQRGSMSFVIRSIGAIDNIHTIENTFVKSIDGTPIYLRSVASVALEGMPPSGIFSKDDVDEGVQGIIMMRRGQNPTRVLTKVHEAIDELNESGELPPGVTIKAHYDRQELVDTTLETVGHSVLIGVTLVVLVLLLFLGRPVMAGLVALTIPFSLLFALCLMYVTNIPIGLLSIGAIDFGIIVDGAIIVAENVSRRLGEATHRGQKLNVFNTVLGAVLEVERSVFFSIVMIVVAYLPLLSLSSIEGLLFRPMALTMVYALVGALIFALFVVPVLATILFRNGYEEWENPILTFVGFLYRVVLRGLLTMRWLVVAAVLCALAIVAVQVAPRLGFEFLPYMDEGVIYIRASFPEGTSLQQTAEYGKQFRAIIREFPDVEFVTTQAGRNDSGTDPFPPNRLEVLVGPRPRARWKQFTTKAELVAALRARLGEAFPTTRFNFTQPIIDNVTEDTNGTSANLAVEFSGPDSVVLQGLAERTVDLLKRVPGAEDVGIEQEGPQPQLVITPDRQWCARHNVRIEDVTRFINTALGGSPIGVVYEGERRFDIVARVDRQVADSPQSIGRLPVYTTEGIPVPLAQVAKIELVDGQTMIARENGRRRITVRCDIVGRDQGGFVAEAQKLFDKEMDDSLPPGYKVAWIGMFENLQRANNHFLKVIPITVGLIFVLLIVTFKSIRAALLLLISVPFAFVGGVLALYARGMNLNVSTGVGFAALFGVSIMNGVLMVRCINSLRQQGMGFREAVVQGALECLRPILLASLVAILGLLPASLATGLGSDVQRPLATVIVWGLFSSTVLTLFVVPILYEIFAPAIPQPIPVEPVQTSGD